MLAHLLTFPHMGNYMGNYNKFAYFCTTSGIQTDLYSMHNIIFHTLRDASEGTGILPKDTFWHAKWRSFLINGWLKTSAKSLETRENSLWNSVMCSILFVRPVKSGFKGALALTVQ